MKVQLIRKLAECLDGIDVSHSRVGDILDLPDREAKLLIAERWAVPDVSSRRPQPLAIVGARECSWAFVRAEAADAPTHRTRTLEQLRHLRQQMEHPQFEQQERRRAEDRVREELQDSRAKTIHHNARD